MKKQTLTKKEIVKKFKISESTINRLIKAGRLEVFRINPPNGKAYFYLDDVENALSLKKDNSNK